MCKDLPSSLVETDFFELIKSNFLVKWATFGQLLKIFGPTFERYSSNLCKSLFISYDEKRYLSQFVSKMPVYLQWGCTTCAPQYDYTSFVTTATYWVPDLPDINNNNNNKTFYIAYISINPWRFTRKTLKRIIK